MDQINKEEYLSVARSVEIFTPLEIDIIEELLDLYSEDPGEDYHVLSETVDGRLLGYVIFGKTPITEFTWDIYWLMVEKDSQGKGIGRKLLNAVENFILQAEPKALIRVETSTRKVFAHARNLYTKYGFIEAGMIPHFYGMDDDLMIYYRNIARLD